MASKRASSSRNVQDHPCLSFDSDNILRSEKMSLMIELDRLKKRDIEIGSIVDLHFVEEIGFGDRLSSLLRREYRDQFGVLRFVSNDWEKALKTHEPVYYELILEFLATFSFDVEAYDEDRFDGPCIRFCLLGEWYGVTLPRFGVLLGLFTAAQSRSEYFSHYFLTGTCEPSVEFSGADFWATIGSGPYLQSNTKESSIVQPEHRLLHRMLVHSFAYRKAIKEKVPESELWLLSRLVDRNAITNLSFVMAKMFQSAGKVHDKAGTGLCGGHFITVIAEKLGTLTPEVCETLTKLSPMGFLDKVLFRSMKLLAPGPRRGTFVWIGDATSSERPIGMATSPSQPTFPGKSSNPPPTNQQSGSSNQQGSGSIHEAIQGLSEQLGVEHHDIMERLDWISYDMYGVRRELSWVTASMSEYFESVGCSLGSSRTSSRFGGRGTEKYGKRRENVKNAQSQSSSLLAIAKIQVWRRQVRQSSKSRGKRLCTYPIDSYVSYAKLSTASRSLVASLDSTPTPKTVGDALAHLGWRNAMIEEMNTLKHNNTWTLVELPANKKIIGCKWVFTVKVNPDGSVACFKARLVAKGYAQTYGVDYSETFSLVAKEPVKIVCETFGIGSVLGDLGFVFPLRVCSLRFPTEPSIRMFISLATTYGWVLHQLDVKNAFLHGDLHEKVYMKQPPGFVAQGESGRVCKLLVTEFGLRRSAYDHSVFFASSSSGCILSVVYVDDIMIIGSDDTGIMKLKDFLASQFQTKDLGHLKYFLQIEVSRTRKGICLSQRKYCLDILNDSGMIETKPCEGPMIPNMKLNVKDGDLLEDPERYRRIVGKLNYLTITRPDIAFPVSVVSLFMSSPRTPHWEVVRHILKYLKGAPGLGILYQNHNHHVIEGFMDADYDGDPTNRRSTTGYCVFVGGNLVSWKSKKQNVVSRSSVESEYRAMAQTTCELIWLRNLLGELGFAQFKPMNLYCDNEAAIHIANNLVFHERTKHIEVDCHFTGEKLEDGTILTPFVRTCSQLADVFTKALPGSRVSSICNKLGMINIYAPA
ncbi:hypothetical protein OSB04_031308 [Centaurea solstitialis]|uniref:Reverse transcriptase Ty1/copia-type domain-containing protein n=1 Tax=Centaurea solstitialis TaxID=347529 RepID=A0AA38S988_9ASTR|nr:hypothetical protein OSB04_031308 [Centaurea solstitialis]